MNPDPEKDGFQANDISPMCTKGLPGYTGQDHNGPHPVSADKLRRSLSPRQVQMIAIGGTIGTGLFLGTGKALATGGPASLLICYFIVGCIVFVTMLSLGEMAAYVPVSSRDRIMFLLYAHVRRLRVHSALLQADMWMMLLALL
jgi:amino acid permease